MSGWADPSKPGEGEFTCGAVRFRIDSIEPADQNLQKLEDQQTQQQLLLQSNADRLAAAEKLYGSHAGDILGQLDLIAACKQAGAQCVITIGGDGSPVVVSPNK